MLKSELLEMVGDAAPNVERAVRALFLEGECLSPEGVAQTLKLMVRAAADIERAEQRPVNEDCMNFELLRTVNLSRALRWHSSTLGLAEWSVFEWFGAMGGEAGEALNAAKKLKRLECKMQQHSGDSEVPLDIVGARAACAKELGDVIAYADLCAGRVGWRLEDCVRLAFNGISLREGFPERLPAVLYPGGVPIS